MDPTAPRPINHIYSISGRTFNRNRRPTRMSNSTVQFYSEPMSQHAWLWRLAADYTSTSSVHGVRYIFQTARHWSERLWWALVVLASVGSCVRLMHSAYDKWQTSPVIVTFDERTTPVWEIPFPAITICPDTKVPSRQLNYTHASHLINEGHEAQVTESEYERLMAMQHICYTRSPQTKRTEQFSANITQTIVGMATRFGSNLFKCFVHNRRYPCERMFRGVITDEGLCYTFNGINPRELYRENISEDFLDENHLHFDTNALKTTPPGIESLPYPFRAVGPGMRAGIFIMMRMDSRDFDYLCQNIQGFKMLMHAPDETPQMTNNFNQLSKHENTFLAIRPQVMTTADRMRRYEPQRRFCYFGWERQLRFYRIYRQRNCELECLTNLTLATCGCVKFSMPRMRETPVCGASRIDCYDRAEDELQRTEVAQGLAGEAARLGCNCLPDCTSIRYDAEVSQTLFSWTKIYEARKKPMGDIEGKFPSGLTVFFKEKQFISSRRSELYGPVDFLASCGGLLGLFMGMSLLSLVEVVYHCTLRLWCNWFRRREEEARRLSVKNT